MHMGNDHELHKKPQIPKSKCVASTILCIVKHADVLGKGGKGICSAVPLQHANDSVSGKQENKNKIQIYMAIL